MAVTLAGTKDKICMIEAGANEVPDDIMLEAIIEGHKVIRDLCVFIEDIAREIGKPKFEYQAVDVPEDVFAAVKAFGYETMRQAVLAEDKSVRDGAVADLQAKTAEHLASLNPEWETMAGDAIYKLEKKVVREYLAKEHRRVDSRGLDEIRPLSAAVGLLPRVHGSGLFQRGQTQVLTTCTLGPLSKAQALDGLDNEEEKRYMHHYNMPGYSTGEAKFARSPGRREIGHGALAERSLVPVLPGEEEFPYAIRCVSEVTMSNGSTSQGSVCASTLALMDAGVPIRRPVAGISAGLIVNEENTSDYMVFMDIQGIEDFFGDMDFKVAGTTEGITSIQVDIKVDGLTFDIIRDAFALTRKGRLQIINDVLLPCLPAPRPDLSPTRPRSSRRSSRWTRFVTSSVPAARSSTASSTKPVSRSTSRTTAACSWLRPTVRRPRSAADDPWHRQRPEPGSVFDGHVTRLMNFGAFVEFLPGKEGLVHISKLAWKRVEKVEDVVKEGDPVRVKVIEIDSQGRINLSIRDTQ
jgi:polyribonucleotide nucleotidyltransferase